MNIFNFNEKNNKYEHLIINGDNLKSIPALYSKYKNTIDLIYIDVPYNDTNDKYYNDNKSSILWLEDMRNILLTLKDMLKKSGTILIHINNAEKYNLQKLCCDIFGLNNFIDEFIVASHPAGRKGNTVDKIYDSILAFSKNSSDHNVYKIKSSVEKIIYDTFKISKNNDYRLIDRPAMWFPIFYNSKDIENKKFTYNVKTISREEMDNYLKIYDKNPINEEKAVSYIINDVIPKYISQYYNYIIPQKNNKNGRWAWGFDTFVENTKNIDDCFICIKNINGKLTVKHLSKNKIDSVKNNKISKIYDNNGFVNFFGTIEKILPNILQKSLIDGKSYSNSDANKLLRNRVNSKICDIATPKNRLLLRDLILYFCPNNGIVLDVFGGSMSTLEGVLMANNQDNGNRKFIGVTDNQGNSFIDLTKPNVIEIIKEYKLLPTDILFGEICEFDDDILDWTAFEKLTNREFFEPFYEMEYIDEDKKTIIYKKNNEIIHVSKKFGYDDNSDNLINNHLSIYIEDYIKMYKKINSIKKQIQ